MLVADAVRGVYQRQDAETLLHCMVHAVSYFGGITATVLTDNMKTVVLNRVDGQPRFHARLPDFASYYGFVPRACHPYRPQTKGKIESTIRYIKSSFWPGLSFDSRAELNRQTLTWCGEANYRVHATTREVPAEPFPREELTPINGQPVCDTSYASHRLVAKDCMLAYRGNRYSVPHAYAGKSVVVREPLESGRIRIFHQQDMIAEHALSGVKGEIVIEPAHYASLPRKSRPAILKPAPMISELTPGPVVGLHYAVPEVEFRSLAIYEEVAHVASSLNACSTICSGCASPACLTVTKPSPKKQLPRTFFIWTSSSRRSKPKARPSTLETCG